VQKIGWLAVAQQLDPCFVAFREAHDELTRRFPRGKFELVPFGVDTDVFRASGEKRDVFAYWMGRRHEPLHRALLRYCRERGLVYRYTERSGEFTDPADLGRLVARSKYFVVTPPDLDNPRRTGGYSPLVMRYLEGLAAGARLLGVLPASGEYEDLLPREAILTVASDGSDLADKLDADRQDGGADAHVTRAAALVRREHSWARRAEQIRERLSS
jgi:glycosyltransferase involved in cell wall biosynthesis